MARFVTTVQTPWPTEKAFDYMADLTNFAQWDPGVRQAKQISGDSPALGAEYEVEVDGVGGPLPLVYRLIEYRPSTEVVAEATTRFLRSYDRVTVSPSADGGSMVTYDAELTLRGIFGLADPLVAIAFNRIGRKAEEGLLKALDGQLVSPGRDR